MKLYVKIHSFEESTETLIVSYASDETVSQNPDDYRKLSIQPRSLWPNVTDPEELKKKIAQIGLAQAAEQKKIEDSAKVPLNIDLFNSLVSNKKLSYDVKNLVE